MMFVVLNLVMMIATARALREYLGMIVLVLTKRNVLTNVHFKIPVARGRRFPRKQIGRVR